MAQERKNKTSLKTKPRGGLFSAGMGIRSKLLFWFLMISLIPVAIIAVVGYQSSAGSMQKQSFVQLESTLVLQRQALQDFFAERTKNIESIAGNIRSFQEETYLKMAAVKNLRKQLVERFFNNNLVTARIFLKSPLQKQVLEDFKKSRSEAQKRYHLFFNNFIKIRDFSSMLVVDPSGKVLYSTDNGIASGLSIRGKGDSPEGEAFKKGLKKIGFIDFKQSALMDGKPVAYIYGPVVKNNVVLGVYLFQMTSEYLDMVMKDTIGLGKTGESYLVGPDGLFRSNSRFFDEPTLANPAFLVDTDNVTQALAGKTGEAVVVNYRGEYVLSSYIPITVFGNTWALIIEMEQTEAISPQHQGEEEDFLGQIASTYGYPDLYLIGRDGYIFYSAKHKADYLTNILTGPYADTGFSQTITKVIETQGLVSSDFSWYEPAGSRPAAFLAKPILFGDEISMVVAVQMPIAQIGSIMRARTQSEFGYESSDTYLVGQDRLWRSESLHTEKYNVSSTLLNPKLSMNTEAVTEALAGRSGTKVITNGIGETVLASWAPFTYKNLHWAMVSEVSKEDVESPIKGLAKIIALIVGLVVLVVGFVSYLVSGGVTRQVSEIMKVMVKVGKDNYEDRAKITSGDELGAMASSFNEMIGTIQSLLRTRQQEHDQLQDSIITLLEEITALSDGDLSVRASVSEDATGTLADSLNLMLEEFGVTIGKIKKSSEQVGATASKLSGSTDELAQWSDAQSRLINDSVKEINRLTAAIERASELAGQSAKTSQFSSQVAGDGAKAVEDTSRAMESIRGNVQNTARAIKRLGESSQEISDFAKTINEISDRTSILALNASIQAAAAGEEGRGFAVVAEEIQRLAERAAVSTKQIETLIKNILGEITEASTSMDASIQEVVHGTSLSKNALARLDEITKRSTDVAELINGVAAASKEQAATTAKLAETMGEIGTVSLETAKETRQASNEMRQMSTMADEMLMSVATFKLNSEDQGEVEFVELGSVSEERADVVKDLGILDSK